MNIESFENVIMLLAIIIALLGSLFHYVEVPRKGYLCLCGGFLAHLLSDYYWTVYTFVMGDNPSISEFIAYFGWNVAYLVMAFTAFYMRDPRSRRYFHPLMLVPIPLNIVQFMIYIQFGGIFNNIWQVSLVTITAVLNIQAIMFYVKNRKNGVTFPYLHLFFLLAVITELGMWTSSCYFWSYDPLNPYYYCAFANYIVLILMPWAAGKDYTARGYKAPEKNADELRFQIRIQIIVAAILFGGCFAGYYFANRMRYTLPETMMGSETFNLIAVALLIFSLFMVAMILGIMYVISSRYKEKIRQHKDDFSEKRNKLNLSLTIIVTFGLMVFSVVYTSRLFYKVSVTGLYETGEDRAETTAATLENYLSVARSTLKVTADTVDLMIGSNESPEKITRYIVKETDRLKSELDENFTGLYAYAYGKYYDGLGWVPPEGYDPTERDWYKEAVAGDGQTVVVSPYVDAQTNSLVITICKMVSEGKDGEYNVVALDVIVNRIQAITEQVDIGGKGYAFIVDKDGTVIAHHDREHVGKNISEVWDEDIMGVLDGTETSTVKAIVGGVESTFFISPIMDEWYLVIDVNDSELFEEVNSQLVVNILVSMVVFGLISAFYFLGYKNEQAYSKKMEEMKAGRQKQEYESQVLRLEKHAADEANKAKSNFLADMSHEIRTPINAILGMNEMILRETSDANVLDYSRNIKNSGRNLLQLINSILDFSKIEDGKMEIIPVRYSLSTLITYIVNSVQERAEAKGLDFIVKVDPNLPSELNGDDTRIDQVILNLLTNAVKYTPEGSVTLIVEERERTADSIKLYVDVRDTGIGIKEDDMGRLFESFERLDMIRNKNIEGTGLGISITTKLLGLMGSELMVQSKYGEGSSFSFELWQKIENPEPIGEYKVAMGAANEQEIYKESFRAPTARILIVDDTKMNIIVVSNLLKKTEMVIDTALNGREAIKLAEDNVYDVILLDQRMPGMDGTETLKSIRALENENNEETPVICLTADAIRGAKERYMAEGFTDYLTKPVEGAELEKMLIKYLPDDKVIMNTGSDEQPIPMPAESDDPVINALIGAGINTDSGIKYCQGDKDLYLIVLKEFATEQLRKSADIITHFDNKEWDDYSILVHSVKSSARTIGATELSELHAKLEKASKDNDIATVMAEHDRGMWLYGEVAARIREILSISDDDAPDDGDVLEFAPE